MSKKIKKKQMKLILTVIIFVIIAIAGYFNVDVEGYINDFLSGNNEQVKTTNAFNLNNIPEYANSPYVIINNNIPNFDESDYTTNSFETYSELDMLGRCGVAYANICKETMPVDNEEREEISSIKPSGWKQKSYKNVIEDGGYLYNRAHLIGWQLAGENANELNLITGTRYMNVEGMLPFENKIAEYLDEKVNRKNHVLYRVTPIFDGNNLVASGVQMEAYSVEDKGKGVCFNIYVYNVQPGITIDYKTGASTLKK